MRISDWSSDVCSSDLIARLAQQLLGVIQRPPDRPTLFQCVHLAVQTVGQVLIAQHAGRHRTVRHLGLIILEYDYELLPVEGYDDGQTQLAVSDRNSTRMKSRY